MKEWVLNIMSVCVCLHSCLSYPANTLHLFCVALYSYMWPAWLYHIIPHYLKSVTGYKKIFSINLSETFLILRRIQRDIIINVHRSSNKVLIIVRFRWNYNVLNRRSRNPEISNSMKIRQWEPCCSMRTDRHDEINSRFSSILKTPLKHASISSCIGLSLTL